MHHKWQIIMVKKPRTHGLWHRGALELRSRISRLHRRFCLRERRRRREKGGGTLEAREDNENRTQEPQEVTQSQGQHWRRSTFPPKLVSRHFLRELEKWALKDANVHFAVTLSVWETNLVGIATYILKDNIYLSTWLRREWRKFRLSVIEWMISVQTNISPYFCGTFGS